MLKGLNVEFGERCRRSEEEQTSGKEAESGGSSRASTPHFFLSSSLFPSREPKNSESNGKNDRLS